jgi:pyrroline-5-carboxylate reductase
MSTNVSRFAAPATLPADRSLAFIGGGNMATAIIGGLLKQGFPASQIWVLDPTEAARERLAAMGVRTAAQASDELQHANIVVWAVKPQQFKEAAKACAHFTTKALHYSVMAGLRSDSMAALLGTQHIVRAMPNTPALVGWGMTGLFARPEVSDEAKQLVEALVAPTGQAMWCEEESLLDAVTAVSGSGPAYVFLLLDAMVQGGMAQGLSHDQANTLALATFAGATELARQSDQSLETLRQQVTSKGGTTHAGITVLLAHGVDKALPAAIAAAHKRAGELGDEFGQ